MILRVSYGIINRAFIISIWVNIINCQKFSYMAVMVYKIQSLIGQGVEKFGDS